MHFLLGILVFSVFCWLMIVSPGFRYAAIGLVVLSVLFVWGVIEKTNRDAEVRNQQLAAQDYAARTSIKKEDLELANVKLTKDFHWILSGTVTNKSAFALGSMTFNVQMQDCPTENTCVVIGESRGTAYSLNVPTKQMRTFSASFEFPNLPKAMKPIWSYSIMETRAQ
jgi:hypothetical protein